MSAYDNIDISGGLCELRIGREGIVGAEVAKANNEVAMVFFAQEG